MGAGSKCHQQEEETFAQTSVRHLPLTHTHRKFQACLFASFPPTSCFIIIIFMASSGERVSS